MQVSSHVVVALVGYQGCVRAKEAIGALVHGSLFTYQPCLDSAIVVLYLPADAIRFTDQILAPERDVENISWEGLDEYPPF